MRFALLLSILILPSGAAAAGNTSEGADRLVFVSDNFANPARVTHCLDLLGRMAKAGYNGVYLCDCKFYRWPEVDRAAYAANLKKIRSACRDLRLKVIIPVCAFSTDMLSLDPNLAEGLPVVEAPFRAKAGKLVPAYEDCRLVNGSFEESRRPNHPDGWSAPFLFERYVLDAAVRADGKSSVCILGHNSMQQTIKVKPFRYYHLSLKVKTEGLKPTSNFFISVAGTRPLIFADTRVGETQDWTPVDLVFNTLELSEIRLSFGNYGPSSGKLWFDDVKIEPAGFVNLIRRPGTPFKLTSDDGKTVYEEGKDFRNASDPQLGNVDVRGIYRMWHKAPEVTLPEGSRIKDGQIVRASYYHSATTHGEATFPCLNEPKIWELAQDNLATMHQVLDPDAYMLPHDEIRCMGYDDSCVKAKIPMAKLLAENIKRCVAMIRKEDPGKPIYLWSDMFDPFHNAAKSGQFFLVKGENPWYGSWEGLDPDLIIMNWNFGEHRSEALKFFAERGHRQVLCGYYDQPVESLAPWYREAENIKGVRGAMYTTWSNNFADLEKFAASIGKVGKDK